MLRSRSLLFASCSTFVLTALALSQGCSAAPPADTAAAASDEIIGGVDAQSASLDAIGVFLLILPPPAPPPPPVTDGGPGGEGVPDAGSTPPDPGVAAKIARATPIGSETARPHVRIAGTEYTMWCTGTLISPTVVLTAEHCEFPTGSIPFFSIGHDYRAAKRIVPVLSWKAESTIAGGPIGLGSDTAIAHLADPIEGVAYYEVATLKPSDVGRRFGAIGYGSQTSSNANGTRRSGSVTLRGLEGNAFGFAYGGFEGFAQRAPEMFGFPRELLTEPSVVQQLQEAYASRDTLKDYEMFLGAARGDAQPCFGDSGGPLVAPGRKVVGVASWVTAAEGALCRDGVVYAAMGPAVLSLVGEALADVCSGVSDAGLCKGAEAFRCTREDEGERRLTRTDCEIFGQTCGVDATGAAACVDP